MVRVKREFDIEPAEAMGEIMEKTIIRLQKIGFLHLEEENKLHRDAAMQDLLEVGETVLKHRGGFLHAARGCRNAEESEGHRLG